MFRPVIYLKCGRKWDCKDYVKEKYSGWERNLGRIREECSIMYKKTSVEISKGITLNTKKKAGGAILL
jgi:hypothetical protein